MSFTKSGKFLYIISSKCPSFIFSLFSLSGIPVIYWYVWCCPTYLLGFVLLKKFIYFFPSCSSDGKISNNYFKVCWFAYSNLLLGACFNFLLHRPIHEVGMPILGLRAWLNTWQPTLEKWDWEQFAFTYY